MGAVEGARESLCCCDWEVFERLGSLLLLEWVEVVEVMTGGVEVGVLVLGCDWGMGWEVFGQLGFGEVDGPVGGDAVEIVG